MPLPVRRRFLMDRFIKNVLMTVAGSARTTHRGGAHASAGPPACISHHPTVEARDTTARTSLGLLAVLRRLFTGRSLPPHLLEQPQYIEPEDLLHVQVGVAASQQACGEVGQLVGTRDALRQTQRKL